MVSKKVIFCEDVIVHEVCVSREEREARMSEGCFAPMDERGIPLPLLSVKYDGEEEDCDTNAKASSAECTTNILKKAGGGLDWYVDDMGVVALGILESVFLTAGLIKDGSAAAERRRKRCGRQESNSVCILCDQASDICSCDDDDEEEEDDDDVELISECYKKRDNSAMYLDLTAITLTPFEFVGVDEMSCWRRQRKIPKNSNSRLNDKLGNSTNSDGVLVRVIETLSRLFPSASNLAPPKHLGWTSTSDDHDEDDRSVLDCVRDFGSDVSTGKTDVDLNNCAFDGIRESSRSTTQDVVHSTSIQESENCDNINNSNDVVHTRDSRAVSFDGCTRAFDADDAPVSDEIVTSELVAGMKRKNMLAVGSMFATSVFLMNRVAWQCGDDGAGVSGGSSTAATASMFPSHVHVDLSTFTSPSPSVMLHALVVFLSSKLH